MSKPREWQAREIYAKWARHEHKEMPDNFVDLAAYEQVVKERDDYKICYDANHEERLELKADLDQATRERDEARAALELDYKAPYVTDLETKLIAERAKSAKLAEACRGLKLRRSLDDIRNVIEALAEYESLSKDNSESTLQTNNDTPTSEGEK